MIDLLLSIKPEHRSRRENESERERERESGRERERGRAKCEADEGTRFPLHRIRANLKKINEALNASKA